jgi:transcriptional regulator with XRE-family HTH domain
MGAKARRRQKYLPAKLLVIRKALGLSQNEILRLIGAEDVLVRSNISNYELGQREPPLFVVLGYARAAGVSTDTLIDDSLELPTRLIRDSRK